MGLNEGNGLDNGGDELAPAGTARVRVCLSRRGCRWADGIAPNVKQQASAKDTGGVWVSGTPCHRKALLFLFLFLFLCRRCFSSSVS